MSPTEGEASRQAAAALLAAKDDLAGKLVALEFARHPELEQRYGPPARAKSLQDAGYHLSYLAQAVAVATPSLFVDYVGWARVVLAQRGVLASDLEFHLGCLAEVLEAHLAPADRDVVLPVLREALAALPGLPDEVPSFIEPEAPQAPLAHQYLQALLRGERRAAALLVQEAADRGVPVADLYLHVFQRTQHEIGRLWQTNRISVAQEHFCTAATQLIMSQLYPRIFTTERTGGTLVATCVSGDLHELGIRMVADFFEMAGWDTYYLGANTPTASVVRTVAERGASVLAISATIAFHVQSVEELVRAVRADPACAGTVILVGGYPFNLNPGLWRAVGADGHARGADAAVSVAQRLTGRGP
jgi:MerR family transcriptional regulator, light-induced transcriptional regulator